MANTKGDRKSGAGVESSTPGVESSTPGVESSTPGVHRVFDRGAWKEAKLCVTCQREFTWRKKWQRCWDSIATCSEKCKKMRKESNNVTTLTSSTLDHTREEEVTEGRVKESTFEDEPPLTHKGRDLECSKTVKRGS